MHPASCFFKSSKVTTHIYSSASDAVARVHDDIIAHGDLEVLVSISTATAFYPGGEIYAAYLDIIFTLTGFNNAVENA